MYNIIDNPALPPRGNKNFQKKYPIEQLNLNQGFKFPSVKSRNVRAAVTAYERKNPHLKMRFQIGKVDGMWSVCKLVEWEDTTPSPPPVPYDPNAYVDPVYITHHDGTQHDVTKLPELHLTTWYGARLFSRYWRELHDELRRRNIECEPLEPKLARLRAETDASAEKGVAQPMRRLAATTNGSEAQEHEYEAMRPFWQECLDNNEPWRAEEWAARRIAKDETFRGWEKMRNYLNIRDEDDSGWNYTPDFRNNPTFTNTPVVGYMHKQGFIRMELVGFLEDLDLEHLHPECRRLIAEIDVREDAAAEAATTEQEQDDEDMFGE